MLKFLNDYKTKQKLNQSAITQEKTFNQSYNMKIFFRRIFIAASTINSDNRFSQA